MSKFTGRYTSAEAASYAASTLLGTATRYDRVALSEMEKDPTELMRLAWKSEWYREYRGGPPREIGKPSGSRTSTRAEKGSAYGTRRRGRSRVAAGCRVESGSQDALPTDKAGVVSYASLGITETLEAEAPSLKMLENDPEEEE